MNLAGASNDFGNGFGNITIGTRKPRKKGCCWSVFAACHPRGLDIFLGLKLQFFSDLEQCFLDFSCIVCKPKLSFLSPPLLFHSTLVSSPAAHITHSVINRLFSSKICAATRWLWTQETYYILYLLWPVFDSLKAYSYFHWHISVQIIFSWSDWFSRATFNTGLLPPQVIIFTEYLHYSTIQEKASRAALPPATCQVLYMCCC